MPSYIFLTVSLLIASFVYVQYQKQQHHDNLCTLWHITHNESKDVQSHKLSQFVISAIIPSSYDKQQSTSNNYASSANNNHVSKYTKIRNSNRIDMAYHNHYNPQRIKLQDQIIDLFVMNNCNSETSHVQKQTRWIIFFGGAPGVGKSYLIQHLSSTYIPELHFNNSIIINADIIRPLLPEYGMYQNDTSQQISLLSKEVGLICELILWVSLEENKSKHIVFDSSLRHTPWFKWLFDIITNEYTQYKLAMIGILSADMKQLRKQVLKRNHELNRRTEWEFVKQVVADVNKSLFELKYLVHIAVNITNPGIPFQQNNKNEFKIRVFCTKSQIELLTDFGDSNSMNLLSQC